MVPRSRSRAASDARPAQPVPAPSPAGFYLVHLKEPHGSDTHTVLVTPTVWAWIHSPYQGDDEGLEPVPEAVLQEMAAQGCLGEVVDGCLEIDEMDPSTDRAAAAPGRVFSSWARAQQHVRAKGVTVLDTFNGDLY